MESTRNNDETKRQQEIVDNDDASSSSSSLGVPLTVINDDQGLYVKIPEKVERPPDGLQWDDNAILNCWNLAIDTHDSNEPTEWQVPSQLNQQDSDFLAGWNPASIPLPLWAVDAFSHPESN